MVAISLENVSKSYGARSVLTGVSLEIALTARIGIVGANGAGKSTLLRLLAGDAPDSGRAARHPRISVELLPQELPIVDQTTWDGAMDAVADVLALRRRWSELATAISLAPHDGAMLEEYGTVQEALERLGGFQIEATVREVISGLGLPQPLWNRSIALLSGGERTRLNLARTLLRYPDVLLLDEPTNHLDIAAIEWLESYLTRFPGGVVTVSHDRRFLDAIAQSIVELEGGSARTYVGNYSAYVAAKQQELAAQVAAFEQHRQDMNRLREFARARLQRARQIQRGPKRGRDHYGRVAKKVARGAKAAKQRLARLEAEGPRKPVVPDRVRVRFAAAARPGEALAHLRAVSVRFGDRAVFAGANLTLERGERVALIGPNGSGKTSLLRLLARTVKPAAGEVWVSPGVRIGYLAQQPEWDNLDRRVIDIALDAGLTPSEARAVLAALLFRGDAAFQTLGTLSGGERTRLALFELIAHQVNLLLLDEPTNHLDLPSRERLEEALEAYEGTLVIASHDRFLLDRLCTTTWAIEDGMIRRSSRLV